MHRDIQWNSIRKIGTDDKWIVNNYDHACVSPAYSPYDGLDKSNHAPEIFNPNGTHDKAVDIWSIGFLIKTAKTTTEDPRLINYSHELMNIDPTKRPTAKGAYQWLWNEYKSCLESDFSRESSMEEEEPKKIL
jgi:hypothetical protein